jgi:hypothetical protein
MGLSKYIFLYSVLAIRDLFKSIENDNDNNYEIFITYV